MSALTAFKFRKIDKRSIDSLIRGSIYFSPISDLNDPFDCRLDINKAIDNALHTSKGGKKKKLRDIKNDKALFSALNKNIEDFGICSFSMNLANVLMWSHYADHHKGMAIMYKFPDSYLDTGTRFIGISMVTYQADILTKWIINNIHRYPEDIDDFILELTQTVLVAKDPSWIYEKEVRMIKSSPSVESIEKSYIKQICFGLDTDESDVELVKEIIRHYDHDVDLCVVTRSKGDFGIDISDI